MLAAALCDLPSVDPAGQSDVSNQDVRHALTAPGQRFLSVACLDYVEARVPQRLDHDFPDERIIL